jgi:hypothetical protein
LTCPPESAHNRVRFSYSEAEKTDVEEQAQRSANYHGIEAGGSWSDGGRCGARVWCVETHDLCLEGKVWRHASEAQKLRSLEDENSRLKRLVADLSLDREMLKAVIVKNGLSS